MTEPARNPAAEHIRITYKRRQATTVALAAVQHGRTVKHMATDIDRLGVKPFLDEDGEPVRLDGRTLLYPKVPIDRGMRSRAGRGAHLRGHK